MKKILIADDDIDFVETLQHHLEKVGYATVTASEGIRVVQMVHKEKPDLILLDWRMPTGTGAYVLESITSDKKTTRIPIIIITGFEDGEIEEKARKCGVVAVIHKGSYEFENLLHKIKEVLL